MNQKALVENWERGWGPWPPPLHHLSRPAGAGKRNRIETGAACSTAEVSNKKKKIINPAKSKHVLASFSQPEALGES